MTTNKQTKRFNNIIEYYQNMFYVLTAKKSTVFFKLLSSLKVSQQMCIYTNKKKVYNTFTTNNIKRCAIRK